MSEYLPIVVMLFVVFFLFVISGFKIPLLRHVFCWHKFSVIGRGEIRDRKNVVVGNHIISRCEKCGKVYSQEV